MSEEKAAAEQASAPDTAGLAQDLAMEEARSDPSLREDVAAFLRDQRSLIEIQKHHLLKQFSLTMWEKRLSVLLRIATAFIGLAVAAGAGWLIWNAARSNDLVIDAFQVPPALAERGLSGPVLAAKLSDKIAAMQARTFSQRSPKSYANSLSEGLKLEIPETGVSLSELDRFLREKLGHDLHIGGEMVVAGNGIALTARIGSTGSATVTGAEADMDALLQTLAEQVYRITQPYRFATWLPAERAEERIAILKLLAASGPNSERAWAYNGWAVSAAQLQGSRASRPLFERGAALDPNHYLLKANLASDDNRMGRTEQSLRGWLAALALLSAHGADYTPPDRIEGATQGYRSLVLLHQGDLLEAARQSRLFNAGAPTALAGTSGGVLVEILAALHEPAAARAALAEYPTDGPVSGFGGLYKMMLLRAHILAALAQRDWSAALALEREFVPLTAQAPGLAEFKTALVDPYVALALAQRDWSAALALEREFVPLTAQAPGLAEFKTALVDPYVALALARLGQFAAAQARLKPMPADCYPCLRARAQVAELQGQDAQADIWFARAAAIGPSLPYAESEWGAALLARGAPGPAIEQFDIAHRKGPKFADPLEGWGEALMALNQSHRALAKFAEAEKYAPNWGRLHLKWGQALAYSGNKEEAAKHFTRAAALDLTPSEKQELARTKETP